MFIKNQTNKMKKLLLSLGIATSLFAVSCGTNSTESTETTDSPAIIIGGDVVEDSSAVEPIAADSVVADPAAQ